MAWFDAATRGKISELHRQLARGQTVDAKDRNGWTALQHAIENEHASAVEFLLKNKANPNFAGAA